ncbi:MAG: methyltransferase [Myxococcota bacterium]
MRGREEALGRLMASCVPELPLEDPVLVVDDASGLVEAAFAARADVVGWRRTALAGCRALPWPPEVACAGASVRLPKGREAQDFVLSALAGRLAAGAPLWIHGANDEGIRSVGSRLESICEKVRVVAARRHGRVVEGRILPARAPRSLGEFRMTFDADLSGGRARLVSYPGTFAHGRLDEGSALLLQTLARWRPAGRVLDFGCGIGVLALGVRQLTADAELDLLDVDAAAMEAARENVPGARPLLGDGFSAVPSGLRYDWIVSNPPFHQGRSNDPGLARQLAREAPRHLAPGGQLLVVVPRAAPFGRWLTPHFGAIQTVARGPHHTVWHATNGGRGGAWCGRG